MTNSVWTWLMMGGYGAYVWSAYGVTFLIFGVNGWASLRALRRARLALQQQWAEHEP